MKCSTDDTPIVLTGDVGQHEEDCACPDGRTLLLFAEQPEAWTNDCACPDFGGVGDTNSITSGATWSCTPYTCVASLVDDFYLVFSPFAPGGPSVLNLAALKRWHSFQTPQPLSNHAADQALVAQRLIQPAGQLVKMQQSAPNTLTAWLHVTNACNLDCPYCYVRKSSERMNQDVGLKAVNTLFSTAHANGLGTIKIKFAGGEATLHFALVRQLYARALELSSQKEIQVQGVVLSNGVRLRIDDVKWMREVGMKLALSLDGIGADHDQQRPMRNGKGSFEAIERTVDEILLPLGVKPEITVTVTRLNASRIEHAVRWALKRNLSVNLNFYRANPQSLSRTELRLEESAIIEGMQAAYRVFEEMLPTEPFMNGLLDRVQAQAHAHTCGVGINYIVITHQGKVAQCQMHLEEHLGSVAEDVDLLHLAATGPIRNLSVDEKEGCRDCTYRYRCSGGCAIETFRSTGRWDVSSPHCNIYKALYPQAMRLEGLRLLKVHGYSGVISANPPQSSFDSI